ncbi:MAG: hypothetical protein M3256_07245 [Actinomycetota bacterium]|jgi:hypothetical protein|nr:hypothetical protein [Actinomycetota bacterium]
MMRSPLPGGLTPKVKQGVSVVIEQILAETEHCGVELELLARISFIRDDQWELGSPERVPAGLQEDGRVESVGATFLMRGELPAATMAMGALYWPPGAP